MAEFPIGVSAKGKEALFNLAMANRHGLIAGATGTGKTVTLQVLAEQFSQAGVSVFTADVKGDLCGIAYPAVLEGNSKLAKRIKDLKIQHYTPHGNPVILWDIYGKCGHPMRTTISEMGPLLMGRLLNLNDTQQGIMNAAFSFADDQGMLLLELKDLASLIDWMGNNADDLQQYGHMAKPSLGAIQRGLLTLKEAGGDQFFGEPAFNINNLFQKDSSGKGIINILDATKLVLDARIYSTFLLWLLSELFEALPEVGDLEKPKLVFFFDEAHLFFNSAPKVLLEKIEQLVRLIRSKGVGVYFITQSPLDVPETVLGQLSNKIQHAMRAFTPKDQKAVKTAAETFRKNPKLDTATAILELSVGEALVSVLDQTGTPTPVEQVKIFPPMSRIGPITDAERQTLINNSPFYGVYEQPITRESAFEMIQKRVAEKQLAAAQAAAAKVKTEMEKAENGAIKRPPGRPRDTLTQTILKTTARTLSTQVGRQIIRGILGSIFGKK